MDSGGVQGEPGIPGPCGKVPRRAEHPAVRRHRLGDPTVGNVHEVAQQVAPDARVVYVDRDPVAVAGGRRLLVGNGRAAVIQADLRDPAGILTDPEVVRLIDFSAPVAILLVAVLHFVLDADDPYRIVGRLRDAAVPGSYLVVSHVTSQGNEALAAAAERVYTSRAADGQARSREQIAAFFGPWSWPSRAWCMRRCGGPTRVTTCRITPNGFWFLAGVACKHLPGVTMTPPHGSAGGASDDAWALAALGDALNRLSARGIRVLAEAAVLLRASAVGGASSGRRVEGGAACRLRTAGSRGAHGLGAGRNG
jgi:hypothetical protein